MASDSRFIAAPIPFPASAPRPARLTAQRALELMEAPRPGAIIAGVAWAGCVSVVVSEPGAGKTFLLLDVAASVSDGVRWHDRAVQPGSAVYLSFEGDALGLRLQALRDRGRHLEHVHVISASDPLSPLYERDGETYSVGELAVIEAICTLARTLEAESRPPIT